MSREYLGILIPSTSPDVFYIYTNLTSQKEHYNIQYYFFPAFAQSTQLLRSSPKLLLATSISFVSSSYTVSPILCGPSQF